MAVVDAECGDGAPVASLDWAEPLGRPLELLALAAGRGVEVHGLSGDTGALRVQQAASLEHDAPVHSVAWDAWGNQLAVGVDGQQVAVYMPDLNGDFRRLLTLEGCAHEEDEGEGQ